MAMVRVYRTLLRVRELSRQPDHGWHPYQSRNVANRRLLTDLRNAAAIAAVWGLGSRAGENVKFPLSKQAGDCCAQRCDSKLNRRVRRRTCHLLGPPVF